MSFFIFVLCLLGLGLAVDGLVRMFTRTKRWAMDNGLIALSVICASGVLALGLFLINRHITRDW